MKKIYTLFLVLTTLGITQQITITGSGCNIRNLPDKTSPVVGTAKTGETFNILETFGYYAKVEVVQGTDKKSTSDHVGKTGYMWVERLSTTNPGESFIIKEGCCLRSSPTKLDTNLVAKVKVGATLKVIEIVPAWYKIGDNKWICTLYTKL